MKKVMMLSICFLLPQAGVALQHFCFPESDMKNPINSGNKTKNAVNNGLSLKESDNVISNFQKIWSVPIAKKYNKKLKVELKWEEDKVNAYATSDIEDNPEIYMFGGLARHRFMSKNALSLILCHELGHHYGGALKSLRGKS